MTDLKISTLKTHTIKDFEKFYKQYNDIIYAAIHRYCYNVNLYDEVASETFDRLFCALEKYDPSRADISTFIYAIVRRISIRICQREATRNIAYVQPDVLEGLAPPSRTFFKFSDLKDYLTEEEYDFIFKLYVLCMTLKQVSIELDISYRSARYRLSLIKEKVKEALNSLM